VDFLKEQVAQRAV